MPKNEFKRIEICSASDDQTVLFACEELARYLRLMSDNRLPVNLKGGQGFEPYAECGISCENRIAVGLFSDFGVECTAGIKDVSMDDAIDIDIVNGKGFIYGTNPRSVLIAVYRFLAEAGCRWLRPGKDGEIIPEKDVFSISVRVKEAASYRHRGICIEGAVSFDNLAEIIDWAPKLGFNAYFIQFREAFTFFDRWYSHKYNPYKKPEYFTRDMARAFVKKAEKEIRKRGLIYHAVGHGWTCEPLGISGLGWDSGEYVLTPEVSSCLALVNGKREVWKGVPLNTNLCYSNPEVRNLIVKDIVNYLKKNKEINILHFWLADDRNNQCECENCGKLNPSDFYIRMLNELDEQLNREGIGTRIVFLIYFDLLWAPEVERIDNPDRFILMFAPYTRSYSSSITQTGIPGGLPPYVRNKLKFPASIEENLAFLKSWQKVFGGDSFDFDYHLWRDQFNDPGGLKSAEILCQDIRNLKGTGLNGYISCQAQRTFFPTGLAMHVMGRTLWNNRLEFEQITDGFFKDSFGEDAESCRAYLSGLSELFDPAYLRGEKRQDSQEAAARFRKIPDMIRHFLPVIERNLAKAAINRDGLDSGSASAGDLCRFKSWEILSFHAAAAAKLANVLEAHADGNNGKALKLWEELKGFAAENEDSFQQVFDLYLFITALNLSIFSIEE